MALSIEQKLKVLENLRAISPRIVFSGGDLLLEPNNLQVVKRASELFGKDNLVIATTGAGMKKGDIKQYIDYVGEVEFTYDSTQEEYEYRQPGYNASTLDVARELVCGKVKKKAMMPLTSLNSDPENIRKIYFNLRSAGIDTILLMRAFPVGRGTSATVPPMNKEDYIGLIEEFRNLEKELIKPKIKLQCALKHLFPEGNSSNPCDFLGSSLGITAQGQLITSPWAYDNKGDVINPDFILGDLTTSEFSDLMSKPEIQAAVARLDENYGHCKIFAYLNSDPLFSSIFLNADPLYSDQS